MKTNVKIILPLLLLSAILILLVGCMMTPTTDDSPGATPETGAIAGIIAAPCCSTSADAVSNPPADWCCPSNPDISCREEFFLQDDIEVILTYGGEEVDTTMTNQKGEYTFNNVPAAKNYVITVVCPDNDRILVKDVAPEVIGGQTFDAEITDWVSTSLGMVVDHLLDNSILGPEDIELKKVIDDKCAFVHFPAFIRLVIEVRRVAEECGDLYADDAVMDALCKAAEQVGRIVIPDLELGCVAGATPGPGPGPTPDPCEGNAVPYNVSLDTLTVIAGCSYSGTVSASDDGIKDPLTYSWTTGFTPPGDMAITSAGAITWNPQCEDICDCPNQLVDAGRVGTNSVCTPNIIKVTVDDGCATTDAEFCIEVINTPPALFGAAGQVIQDMEVAFGCDYTRPLVVADPEVPDCQTISLTLVGNPASMCIDESGAKPAIYWAPTCDDVGNSPFSVTLEVSDGCATVSYPFTATATNAAPTIDSIDAMSVAVGCCLDPTVFAVGHDDDIDAGCNQTLAYSFDAASDTPPNMSIDSATGEITWCPDCAEEESSPYTVVVKVEDDCGASATASFEATATNATPTIDSIDAMSAVAGCCLDPTVFAVGHDDDIDAGCSQTLTYSFDAASDTPPNMDIDSATGEITWCPTCAELGCPYTVVVKVEDDCGASATASFEATATNAAPTITSVEFTNEFTTYPCDRCNCTCVVIEDSKTLHIKVTAEDPDDCQTLTYSLNSDASDLPLPPVGLASMQTGNEFTIDFNANCYDQCINCVPEPAGVRGCDWFCDCWWEFIIRVTDGCETDDVCIRVCVADIIND